MGTICHFNSQWVDKGTDFSLKIGDTYNNNTEGTAFFNFWPPPTPQGVNYLTNGLKKRLHRACGRVN